MVAGDCLLQGYCNAQGEFNFFASAFARGLRLSAVNMIPKSLDDTMYLGCPPFH